MVMKFQYFVVMVLLSAVIVAAGCSKPLAGQAISGFSDVGCVEGPWVYLDGAGNYNQFEAGCTTQFADMDANGNPIPWCATSTVSQGGYDNVYITGNGMGTTWKECSVEEVAQEEAFTGEESRSERGRGERAESESQDSSEEEMIAEGTGFGGKEPVPCSDSDYSSNYQITLVYIDDDEVKFIINGVGTNKVKIGQNAFISPKFSIEVKDIVYQAYEGGIHSVDITIVGSAIPITDTIFEGESKYYTLEEYWKNPSFVKGTLTNPDGEVYEDFCSKGPVDSSTAGIKVGKSEYVYEYYCMNSKKAGTKIIKCNGGCEDGKCLPYNCGGLMAYPQMFVKDGVFDGNIIVGEKAPAIDNLAATDIMISMNLNGKPVIIVDSLKLDFEIINVSAQNMIVVGSPCVFVNDKMITLSGEKSISCEGPGYDQNFLPGQALIKLIKHPTGKHSLIVSGYSGTERRVAAKVIAQRANELTGTEILVEGETFTDATLTIIKGDCISNNEGDTKVVSICGDGKCNVGETVVSCPADCSVVQVCAQTIKSTCENDVQATVTFDSCLGKLTTSSNTCPGLCEKKTCAGASSGGGGGGSFYLGESCEGDVLITKIGQKVNCAINGFGILTNPTCVAYTGEYKDYGSVTCKEKCTANQVITTCNYDGDFYSTQCNTDGIGWKSLGEVKSCPAGQKCNFAQTLCE